MTRYFSRAKSKPFPCVETEGQGDRLFAKSYNLFTKFLNENSEVPINSVHDADHIHQRARLIIYDFVYLFFSKEARQGIKIIFSLENSQRLPKLEICVDKMRPGMKRDNNLNKI